MEVSNRAGRWGERRPGSGCPRTSSSGDICFHSQPGAELGWVGLCLRPSANLRPSSTWGCPGFQRTWSGGAGRDQAPGGLVHTAQLSGSESAEACPMSHSAFWTQGHPQACCLGPPRPLGAQESILISLNIRTNKQKRICPNLGSICLFFFSFF